MMDRPYVGKAATAFPCIPEVEGRTVVGTDSRINTPFGHDGLTPYGRIGGDESDRNIFLCQVQGRTHAGDAGTDNNGLQEIQRP